MPETILLRVMGRGEIEVDHARSCLASLKYAYESILVFDAFSHDPYRDNGRLTPVGHPLSFSGDLALNYFRRSSRDGRLTRTQIASFVSKDQKLVLARVRLASPGFWDLFGLARSLDVIRQYLHDRHVRRQNRDYREAAENMRLGLENLSLENRVIAERLEIARRNGASEEDIRLMLRDLVIRPLRGLDRHQNRGVIGDASLLSGISHKDE